MDLHDDYIDLKLGMLVLIRWFIAQPNDNKRKQNQDSNIASKC